MDLGEKIRELRIAKGITLRGLARAIGVSAPFLSDVEHGRRRPTEDRLDAMANVLGCKPSELEDLSLTREAARRLERDPELLKLIRHCLREPRYRRLILRAVRNEV